MKFTLFFSQFTGRLLSFWEKLMKSCRFQVDAAHWWWLRRFPPFYVKRFECPEKRYINVMNYYYY